MSKSVKYKHVYAVYLHTKYGIGCQPVKANTQKEARERFKKRFKKSRIISVEKSDAKNHIIKPI